MYLLIVADGTLFVPIMQGEIMCNIKDSLGREFLAAEDVYSDHIFGLIYKILLPAGDLPTTSLYPEACIIKTRLKIAIAFKNEPKS